MGDDWSDEDDGWVKEEPDCGRCSDSGRVHSRLTGRYRARRCPSCDPTWLDVIVNRIRNWLWNLRRRPGLTTDEPPF